MPRRLLHDDGGAAAIEFALVALPFLLFILGLLGMGLYYLAGTSLEYGVEAAARKIRTGEAEKGAMTVGQFRNLVCQSAGVAIDCGNMSVIVQHEDTWGELKPQSCLDKDNNMSASTGTTGEQVSKYSGSAGQVVLVTLCYRWDMAENFKFLKLGSGTDGSGPAIIQAATAFKSEPYN
ncbi:TadE/TadG family type IV pilus assembly protein [Hyphomicrobium sp.]|uniref:TadE/TadG family type IV pilus assembly protein n=1 Tax=Hyphomicrobium sp. TaxID=82 RepID=UPI0025C66A76|nr:TadE/TadG family type IV pilus assembly protein [Hyphomicrobium sp.]